MRINDAHCHFFSTTFFTGLARQLGRAPQPSAAEVCRELQWDDPGTPEALADRWVAELDAHGVARASLIASLPGDEASVASAVARHPQRFVGCFMVDPSRDDAVERTVSATTQLGLRVVCLFPAMHRVALDDPRTLRVIDAAASTHGVAVFVHCGALTVGVRRKLGLPSPFDLTLGDPSGVARLARRYRGVPFIIPHFGAGRFDDALAAARESANVYLDTSSSNGWIAEQPGRSLAKVFLAAIDAAGPQRVLFGTDSSFFPRGWQRGIFEAQSQALEDAGVSEGERALILGANVDRLFPAG